MSGQVPFETDCLAVIGPGLLGTSVALGLKSRGFTGRIIGVGRSTATLAAAEATGAYDTLTTDTAQAIREASFVLVAVPLGAFDAVFGQIAEHGRPGLVVTDVGSTKSSVIAAARRHMSDLSRVVGSHPMAGSEQAGPAAGDGDLFVDRPCVMTVAPTDAPEAVALVAALWRTLGMRLIEMSPAEHDRQVATISHLPHLVSVMLMGIAGREGGLEIASSGFSGMTRLAASNPAMRADIIEANRENLRNALGVLRIACDEMDRLLDSGDRHAVERALAAAAHAHAAWRSADEEPS